MRQVLIQSKSQNCLELEVPTIGPQTLQHCNLGTVCPIAGQIRNECTHESSRPKNHMHKHNSENLEVILLQKMVQALVHSMGFRLYTPYKSKVQQCTYMKKIYHVSSPQPLV